MPASSSASSSSRPDGPDERLARAILLVARLLADEHQLRVAGPSPNTVCVASFQSGQAWHAAAASRSVGSVSGTSLVHYPRPPCSIPPEGGFGQVAAM